MSGNSLGKIFKITSFGESHGKCIGIVIDGCPPGIKISKDYIQKELNKRKPGKNNLETKRKEEDQVEILSGFFKGLTTGAPICMIIRNKDVDSSFYEEIKNKPRPGHADYTSFIKYKGFNDYRGGGRFSGRITAGFVMADAVAKKILEYKKIEVNAKILGIGGIKIDKNNQIEEIIKKIRKENDSLGGIVECKILNVPVGLGEPVFDNLESDLSKALFSIPAIKGVEFGKGFESSKIKGSENNDEFLIKNGKIYTKTNNSGGILGGISNGMPITFRIAIKPTPSIRKKQRTIDLKKMKENFISIEGRHDICIALRAIHVVESIASIVIADHLIRSGLLYKGN